MDLHGLSKLIETVRALRDPASGCPWDRAQTHESLKPYALEEIHEFLESLDSKGSTSPETWEELGDVLFQVVLHSQLLSERGLTHLDEIAGRTAAKLVERHPHVFDPNAERFSTPEQVNLAWERLKAQRKATQAAASVAPAPQPSRAERVASVPRSLPALQRAARVGEKAAAFNFDWRDANAVLPKVREELNELEEALSHPDSPATEAHAQEEFGDLLFALAQYARKRCWDPESLLAQATRKFLGRFEIMEQLVEAEGHQLWDTLSLEALDAFWNQAKKRTSS